VPASKPLHATLRLGLPCLFLGLTYCAGGPSSKDGHDSPQVLRDAVVRAQARNLVDVRSVVPGIVCDLRYTTDDNITHQPLYPKDMPCLLLASTAQKLRQAQETLRAQGFGLKIWDGWRPPEVQTSLFDHGGYTGMFTPPSMMWSRHCSGTAVDVTLVDSHGHELKMPTKFDEGGPQCHYLAIVKDEEVRKRRHALQMAMLDAGFGILETEWWHFDDADFNSGPAPTVVFAGEIGMALPPVKEPKVRRGPPTYVQ
jgi:D-alanyl-D-alanine dipeptidase